MELQLSDDLGKISYEIDCAEDAKSTILIAHGAGAGMHHPFLVDLASKFREHGINALRFNFLYMEQGRKSPGSPKKNIATWKQVVEFAQKEFPDTSIFLSGKSYGGRMASHLLSDYDVDVSGVIYFGFPLHAPGRDSMDRADHLHMLDTPQLFLQGTKDKLANIEMMREVVSKQKKANIIELEDGDHSFNVPKKSGKTRDDVLNLLVHSSVDFMKTNG